MISYEKKYNNQHKYKNLEGNYILALQYSIGGKIDGTKKWFINSKYKDKGSTNSEDNVYNTHDTHNERALDFAIIPMSKHSEWGKNPSGNPETLITSKYFSMSLIRDS